MSRARSFFNERCCCFFLAFYLVAVPRVLRSQELVFRHYGASEGLPSSETYCVIQDSSGYMWFGTDRGLVKFNGYDFTTFTSADGLPDNTVFGLYEDYHRRIWLGTYTARTGYIYDDKPQAYVYNAQVKSLARSGISNGMYYDSKDRLWISHTRPNDTERQVHYIDTLGRLHTPPVLPEPGYKDIYITTPGACFIYGSPKAPKTRIVSAQTDQVLFRFPIQNPVPGQAFSFTEKDGTLWICVAGQVWSFTKDKIVKHLEYKGKLLSFMVDEHKNLWLGFFHKGLVLYLAAKNYKEPIALLDAYSISGMCFDREHGKWFTSLENGIFYLPPGLCFSYSRESGLSSANVLQLDYFNGHVLAVQSDFNASVKKRGSQKFNRINLPNSEVYMIKKGTADTFYYTSNGRPIRFSLPGVFIHNFTQKISLTAQRLWGMVGSEVLCFNRKGALIKLLSVPHIGRATCVFEKKLEQHFLVGTIEGLYEYRHGTLKALSRRNLLLKERISGVLKLRDGELAVATMGQGLVLVREDNYAQIQQYTMRNGLPGVMCNAMIKENDSVLWIGTNKGLCRISNPARPGRVKFQTIDMHNGLASNEIKDLCFADKALWIATQNGISVLHNPGATEVISQPPLLIEKVLVNGMAIHPLANNVFSHRQNNITIFFVGLNYQHPGEFRYRYRLKGADSSWKVTSNRTILYSALMPGSYNFEIQAVGPNGYVFVAIRSLAFTILAPYWQSWWFILLLITFAAAGIYGFVAYRVNYVRKQARLRHDLDLYRDKALRAQMNPHFIYNAMNAIQNFITKNETGASVDFLSRFSRLMRLTFQNSFTELVVLEKDLEALILYTEMESIRFPGRFSFRLGIAENIKTNKLLVPPLLIQPFVENAVLHAFAGMAGTGSINLEITQQHDKLCFAITDNGIGRSEAGLHQKKKQKYRPAEERKESGITITTARIRQAWGGKQDNSFFKITDLVDAGNKAIGTLVEFYLPIHYD